MSRIGGIIGGGVSLCAVWALSESPLSSRKTVQSVESTSKAAYCAGKDDGPSTVSAALVTAYKEWLRSRGTDIKLVELHGGIGTDSITARLSSAGRNICLPRWFGFSRISNIFKRDPVLLSFPVLHAISKDSSAIPKDINFSFEDESRLIIHLLIEKLRGTSSYLSPWLAILPERFSLPMCWTDDELEWLKGTSLHKGTMLKRKELERVWEELEPICHQIINIERLPQKPSFEDFLWATAAFQSMSVPLPQSGTSTGFSMQLLPGTEILQPSPNGDCIWSLDKSGESLCAVCSRRRLRLKQGNTPLTVSVGDDLSMEQLIFQYGVIEMDPQREVLMINCPIPPPDQWDDTFKKRLALLLENGLGPQLFLSQKHYDSISQISQSRKHLNMDGSERQRWFEKIVPKDVLKTVEIFVMDADDLEDIGSECDASDPQLKSSGMRMAVMTTIVRLLELKLYTLQHKEDGTGTLESDEILWEACNDKGDDNDTHHIVALRHRMAQKSLTRRYLKIYSDYLQEEMRYLHQLQNDL